jgi:putative membrane protein
VLFYLPRLFVYHAENKDNEGFVKVAKVMERKLYRFIGIPAFWATLISGIALIALSKSYYGGASVFAQGGWMHAKSTLLVFLIVFFFSMGRYLKQFAEDRCEKSGSFFRKYNEIPTVLMLLIVAMVIVKPF